jgi:cytoskeleton protein RodZ
MTLTPTLKQEAKVSEQTTSVDGISRMSPGAQLSTAREARRLTVDEVAKRLHLTRALIADIENDRYDKRLSFTFIRGYLRAYARLVRISPEAVINSFEQLGLTEQRSYVNLHKIPATTWRSDKYLKALGYGFVTLLLAGLVGAAAWWIWQSPAVEEKPDDLIKLLNNINTSSETRSTLPLNGEAK